VENKMENQKFVIKRYRHNQFWEFAVIEGTFYLTIKDVLKYFGYSISSHRSITSVTDEKDRLLIQGGPIVKEFQSLKKSGMLITIKALGDFIDSRQDDRMKAIGNELISWIVEVPAPELLTKYNRLFPGFGPAKQPEETKTQKQSDLFNADLEARVKELEEKVELYETVIDELAEKVHFKFDHMWQTIDELGKSIDKMQVRTPAPVQSDDSLMNGIQALISKFGGGTNGNV
jgi:uncharacterized coiled-coil protein SlyX